MLRNQQSTIMQRTLVTAVGLCLVATFASALTQNTQKSKQLTTTMIASKESSLRGSDIGEQEAESLMNEVRLNPSDFLRQDSKIANARVEIDSTDKVAAAGHHHGKGHHGKYYQYVEVPKKKAFKMGFKRGNKKHLIMRKEEQHGPHNHGYFKWHDKKGKGMHKWDYNHYKKHKKHHHYG